MSMHRLPPELRRRPARGAVKIASSLVRRRYGQHVVTVAYDAGRSQIWADLTTALGLRLYRYGTLDDDVRIVCAMLRPGDVFIDGGTHVGLFTLAAARQVGPSGSVIACEPAPVTFGRLVDNIALNSFSWARPLNVALSDCEGSAEFITFEGDGSALSSFAPASAGAAGTPVTVRTTTLDELAGDGQPALVKLDLEGAEVRALRGASRLLAAGCPFVVEVEPEHLCRQGSTQAELFEIFKAHGYVGRPFGSGPNWWFRHDEADAMTSGDRPAP